MKAVESALRIVGALGMFAAVMIFSSGPAMAGTPKFQWTTPGPRIVQLASTQTGWTRLVLFAEAQYIGALGSDQGRAWSMDSEIFPVTPATSDDVDFSNSPGVGAVGTLQQDNQIITCGSSCAAAISVQNCHNGNNRGIAGRAKAMVAIEDTTALNDNSVTTTVICPSGGSVPNNDEDTESGRSPIILDLDGNGFHLAGPDDSVLFDINADGELEELTWTKAGERDAFLVLDRNRNGFIDDGSELFGDSTPMLADARSAHGYQGLAQYDAWISGGNENRIIDSRDFIFPSLQLWIDENHDGISSALELFTLQEMGITRVELDYREDHSQDGYGNRFKYNSRAWKTHGRNEVPVRTTDVFFDVLD